jgi:hypothetical protein
MEITLKMQQVIDLGNQHATKVTYERDKVTMVFDAEVTTTGRTHLNCAVGTISVEIGRKHCLVGIEGTSVNIRWFSSSITEYHTSIGKMLAVVYELINLGYTSP